MDIALSGLKPYVDIKHDADAIAEKLTALGLEVDGLKDVSMGMHGLVIGKVLSCEKHPDANKLSVTQVDLGDEVVQIVCGAPNVCADIKVVVAKVGALLPGNFKIKAAKLRGVDSCGMICSEDELGLCEDRAPGIMILSNDAPVGQCALEYFDLHDHIVSIDLTPNRGDCLSYQGVAREIAMAFEYPFTPVHQAKEIDSKTIGLSQDPLVEDACLDYALVQLDAIDAKKPLPQNITRLLQRSGIRPVSSLVDITQYVMLQTGQPLHAFDKDKITLPLSVRYAKDNESMVLIDDTVAKLDPSVLVIVDQNGPVAIAGVMGSKASAVDENTSSMVLEAGHFTQEVIAQKAQKYKLNSDAAYRFSRGVGREKVVPALKMAIDLLGVHTGAQLQGWDYKTIGKADALKTLSFAKTRIAQVAGISFSDAQIRAILEPLGFAPQISEDAISVHIPSDRFDVALDVDIIEELLRAHGYDHIKAVLPHTLMAQEAKVLPCGKRAAMSNQLVQRGFLETVNYSFINKKWQQGVMDAQQSLQMRNPLSEDLSQMRKSLLPSLLHVVAYNIQRQQQDLRFFEIANVYHRAEDAAICEQENIAFCVHADRYSRYYGDNSAYDFSDLKADVFALLHGMIAPSDLIFKPIETAQHPYMHPGLSAQISYRNQDFGVMGALHPEYVKNQIEKNKRVWVFEAPLARMLESGPKRYKAVKMVSKFPAVSRDLAFIVDESVQVGDIKQAISKCAKSVLQELCVFDVFRGGDLQKDQKSVALSLVFCDDAKTLNDDDIAPLITRIIDTVEKRFNAILRG